MSQQTWMEALAVATVDGTAVANTTTETTLGDYSVPAYYGRTPRTLRLTAYGKHSTTGTPTMIFSLRWGGAAGVLVCKTGTITTISGASAAMWDIAILITVRSDGATGTIMANGFARVHGATAPTPGSATGAPAIGPMTNGGQTTPAAATVDLTADKVLSLTMTWSAASASNTATLLNYLLESIN